MASFDNSTEWLSAAGALRGQNRIPVGAAPNSAAQYSRTPTPRSVNTVRDPIAALRQSLDANITFTAMASLPFAWATGQIGVWFDKYVYSPEVEAIFAKLQPSVAWLYTAPYILDQSWTVAEAIAIGYGKSWGVAPIRTLTYKIARSQAARVAALAFGRALLAATRGVFQRILTVGGRMAARHMAANLAGPTPLGVVVHGALVVVDAALVLDCAVDLMNIRSSLIESLCAMFEGREPQKRSVLSVVVDEVLNARPD